MEESEKINVNLAEGDTAKTLVVLHGKAPVQRDVKLKEISIRGGIKSPIAYVGKSETRIDFNTAVFYVNRAGYSARFDWGLGTDLINSVEGVLNLSADLDSFGINGNKKYSLKGLAEFLKQNRVFSHDREGFSALISSLRSFKATIEQNIEKSYNDVGSKKTVFEQEVRGVGEMKFILNMPLFVDSRKYTFEVDVCFDVDNGEVFCWLSSAELLEMKVKYRDEALDELCEYFEPLCPVIYV